MMVQPLKSHLFLFTFVLAQSCWAQLCMPDAQPRPEDPTAYIHSELSTLRWIGTALHDAQAFGAGFPTPDDPERLHKMVELYSASDRVAEDYDCAVSFLKPYEKSKTDHIAKSVDALLTGLSRTKEINSRMMDMMEAVNQAKRAEDVDVTAIAKFLAYAKAGQENARILMLLGVKFSTLAILRVDGEGDDAKPVAFTITSKQRTALLAEVQAFAGKKPPEQRTVADQCAAILLNALTQPLPNR